MFGRLWFEKKAENRTELSFEIVVGRDFSVLTCIDKNTYSFYQKNSFKITNKIN